MIFDEVVYWLADGCCAAGQTTNGDGLPRGS